MLEEIKVRLYAIGILTKDIVGVVIRKFGGDGDIVEWTMNIPKRSTEMTKSVRVSLLISSSLELGFFSLMINIYIVERSREIMFARMDCGSIE